MKGVIFMFKFLRKRNKKEDPTLKDLIRQTEELKSINDSLYKHRESVEANIQKAESLLLSIGYSQEDLDKIRTKSKLKIIK